MSIEILQVLVSSGEDTDPSVSLIRLSSYLSVSTEDSQSTVDLMPSEAAATDVPAPKSKDGEVGFPDIPFRDEPGQDDHAFDSSKPSAKPVIRLIEGTSLVIYRKKAEIIQSVCLSPFDNLNVIISSSASYIHAVYKQFSYKRV